MISCVKAISNCWRPMLVYELIGTVFDSSIERSSHVRIMSTTDKVAAEAAVRMLESTGKYAYVDINTKNVRAGSQKYVVVNKRTIN
jgi:hypothetical protein